MVYSASTFLFWSMALFRHRVLDSRDVKCREFHIETRRVLETNVGLGMDDALNVWMLQHSKYHAVQLWLGEGPWEVEWRTGWEAVAVSNQITKRACLSHVIVSCQTRPTDCCHPRLIARCGCNCPTMNSPSHAYRLGRVYSLANLNWLQMQCW